MGGKKMGKYKIGGILAALMIAAVLMLSVQPAAALTNETYANLTIAEVISTTLAQDPIFFCSANKNTFDVETGPTQADDSSTTYDCNDDSQINGYPVNLTIEEITNVDTETAVRANASTYSGPTAGVIDDANTCFCPNSTSNCVPDNCYPGTPPTTEATQLSDTSWDTYPLNWSISASSTDEYLEIYWWLDISDISWLEAGEYFIGVCISTVKQGESHGVC